MEFEFDKEIDALLRQTAQGETASANLKSKIQNPKSLHLDADEISLFAENTLPEKAKTRFTEHFAGCDRCRKILSNVILLNSETISETVHAPQIKKTASVAPWYRRLFAVPNLAYALGALVLVFGGLFAFTFLRNAPRNAEVSQAEIPIDMKGVSSGIETKAADSNAAMSNSSSTAANSAATNSAPVNRSNASTANVSPVFDSATANKQNAAKSQTAKNEPQSKNETVSANKDKTESPASDAIAAPEKKQFSVNGAENARENNKAQTGNNSAQTVAPAPKSTSPAVSAGSVASLNELPVNGRTAMSDAARKSERKMSVESIETRKIGGKTFRRQNNVWYDASYNGQSATNIRRDSEDFKKLDSGLRSIADSLSGTIVVIWKGKAYRIQ